VLRVLCVCKRCANEHTPACAYMAACRKTTFIKFLLQREYPGIHIGPEPTTDRRVTSRLSDVGWGGVGWGGVGWGGVG
jgi:hypothetical protein